MESPQHSAPEWSIQEIVRSTGVTSRTLRHYQQVGLLAPSRTGHGGQRFYDGASLRACSGSSSCASWGSGFPRSAACSTSRSRRSPRRGRMPRGSRGSRSACPASSPRCSPRSGFSRQEESS
ncbi:MerR family DNA-binding transcriptional regulator [Brachybacterium sp. GPGPB12]|uniref:MerR family transcriptional regulator n=1 Tax=Brachybacterium sp. GPGPB12 TaxID=3023517 RepID=UPI00313445D2